MDGKECGQSDVPVVVPVAVVVSVSVVVFVFVTVVVSSSRITKPAPAAPATSPRMERAKAATERRIFEQGLLVITEEI